MFTKYGTSNVIVMLTVAFLLIVVAIIVHPLWIRIICFSICLLLTLFTFLFFRDPDRNIPAEALADPSMILAPADGRVVAIVETEENTFIKGKATQISIFLSPLDVHVNRSPASGIIKYFKYLPGDYIVAYHPKSSIKNEQTHIGLENNAGKVFFKQIVGILARRLVWDIKEGDTISAGQKFGMMKFGSRMDVFVPQESTVFLKKGQRVIAGETIMARLK